MPGEAGSQTTAILRPPQPGELGWIVQVHGALYHRRFGWGVDFEREVAEIVARWAAAVHDPRQACWIAARGRRPVGSVMLAREGDGGARLRVLMVLESERRTGLGRQLCEAVIEKARECRDQELVLSTTNRQTEARALYRQLGFEKVAESPNTTFARGERDELWRLLLTSVR